MASGRNGLVTVWPFHQHSSPFYSPPLTLPRHATTPGPNSWIRINHNTLLDPTFGICIHHNTLLDPTFGSVSTTTHS
ncbi:hypothetical protein DPMN_151104 [Dreissena polymorpha]|uniref:Uncharacterized protein n=1 Tax=Dreissena polymorpha TaxID=45954 RepID=A0A9D4J6M3_DREPO|nr:hypothetical protein DPMN_151104 [Dreissena polymorpha]